MKGLRGALIGTVVLGIVVLLVVAANSGYDSRRYVTQVIQVAMECRDAVSTFAEREKSLPSSARQAGCAAEPRGHSGRIRVSGGRIDVEILDIDSRIDGRSFVLEATSDTGQRVRAATAPIGGWRCSATVAPENYKFFPGNCRQAPLSP